MKKELLLFFSIVKKKGAFFPRTPQLKKLLVRSRGQRIVDFPAYPTLRPLEEADVG